MTVYLDLSVRIDLGSSIESLITYEIPIRATHIEHILECFVKLVALEELNEEVNQFGG